MAFELNFNMSHQTKQNHTYLLWSFL